MKYKDLTKSTKIVFDHLCDIADSETLTTRELTFAHIAIKLSLRPGTVKNILQILVTDRYIKRIASKKGRGGFVQYKLARIAYEESFANVVKDNEKETQKTAFAVGLTNTILLYIRDHKS